MERGLGIANMQVSDGHVDSAKHALCTIIGKLSKIIGKGEKEESVDLCLYV